MNKSPLSKNVAIFYLLYGIFLCLPHAPVYHPHPTFESIPMITKSWIWKAVNSNRRAAYLLNSTGTGIDRILRSATGFFQECEEEHKRRALVSACTNAVSTKPAALRATPSPMKREILRVDDQLKKYGDSRTFSRSKSPLSGSGGKVRVGCDVWKLLSSYSGHQ